MARAVKAKPITARDLIEKRRARWEELHDIDYDRRIVEAAARKILEDKEIAREIYEKPYLLIETAFLIVDKQKETVPFFLNEVQRDFIERFEEKGTEKPYFILKGRQQGFTSLITAIQLSYAIVRKNFSGMTLANTSDNALAIFNDKAKTVYARLPEILKPHEKFNSKRELFFDKANSSWRIDTASAQVGRSRTPNFVHYSEVAFFECTLSALQKSMGEASTRDAFVVYETTANGFNEAKSLWDSGACTNLSMSGGGRENTGRKISLTSPLQRPTRGYRSAWHSSAREDLTRNKSHGTVASMRPTLTRIQSSKSTLAPPMRHSSPRGRVSLIQRRSRSS